jgi:RimJ/RimL family protein N-acetyltransferase
MRTSRIVLRDVIDSDLPTLFEHQSDPLAYRPAAFTPRDRDAFLAHWAKIRSDPTVLTKAIVLDGRLVGNVASFLRDGVREIGYWIGRDSWGQGIASEALARFLELETSRPVYAVIAKGNTGSLRVAQKCGFEIVGKGVALFEGKAIEDIILRLGDANDA